MKLFLGGVLIIRELLGFSYKKGFRFIRCEQNFLLSNENYLESKIR